ncbi:MAG: choice-of-anchor L domain-containing protein [Planctomycetes bacterium]|nr:choice-of-anchor L domain-containing protein [Planctomycetota bacterium]
MRKVLVLALALLPAIPLAAQTPEQLAHRAAIAAKLSGRSVPSTDTPTAMQIEAALDLPAGTASSIVAVGDGSQITAPTALGVIAPQQGNDMLLLSTGVAGTSGPEPGTGFGAFGGAFGNDTASVTLTITVPPGATTLSFDCRFLSAEYPDFVQAGFNDTFSARLTTSSGTQELAFDGAGRRIEVDSVSFFPAFTSNAGGTGFDIFTEDPEGVDTVFDGGLPDAGLTDWISASGTVTPGDTITIAFGIGDLGDDILDSAVLIDNLKFSSLEVLDGGDAMFLAGNDLTNDPETLAAGGEARIGICADGTSRLLLRMNLPAPGTVDFTIAGFTVADEYGALGNPGAAPAGAMLTVNSVNTTKGDKAYAVFHAPLDFVRAGVAGDQNARMRTLTIDTAYTPMAGPVENGTLDLTIERPPLVLCHGLWSNPATWNAFDPLLSSGLFDISRVDYSNNNAGRIAVNRFQVRRVADQANASKRRRGIASTQVDWIGHSMGGLLARSFVATGFYRRPDNFGSGDLHKLISLNTPHWGSPFANLLVGIRETFFLGDLLVIGMERLGMSVVGGAIDDLSEGSAALAAIGPTPVRGHAIGGRGGSQAIGVADIGLAAASALAPPPYNAVFRVLGFLSAATTAAIYRGQEHDFIVLLPSQHGGLAGAAISTFGGLGSIHTSITGHAPASTQCVTLLNARSTGATFAAAFPAPNLAPPVFGDDPMPAPAGEGITITTTPGPVAPGATVTVDVQAFGGYVPTAVLFVSSSQEFLVDNSAPFSATFTVPTTSIGDFSVMAIAEDAGQFIAGDGPIAFPVTISATLTGIELYTERVYFTKVAEAQGVSVIGDFSDGVQRDVTSPALGTTWLTSDPNVVAVSADGVLTAVGEGSAAVVAQNGGFEVSLGVFVGWEADVSVSGQGCPTTFGVPEIGTAGGLPVIGNLGFELTAANLPVPGLGSFLLQIGPSSPTGTPIVGGPPCLLRYVTPVTRLLVMPSATGTGSMPIPIPNDPAFAGLPLGAQVLAWDFALTGFPLPIGSSMALDVYVGH